jgi:hypothetical protein
LIEYPEAKTMDMTLVLLGGTLLLASVIISVSIERLIRHLGVSPEKPDDRSNGFRDVVQRIDRWRQSRENPDR